MSEEQQPTPKTSRPNQIVPLGSGYTWFIGLFTLFLVLGLFVALIALWPYAVDAAKSIGAEQGADQDVPAAKRLVILGLDIPPGLQLMLLAMVMGGLGGSVHTAASFIVFVGNRQLAKSWIWWYALWPFIAMTLAVIVYFVIRAGFLTFGSTPTELNPYGIAAISALAGMFAKQTTEKLREIMELILNVKTPTPLHDGAEGDDPPGAARVSSETNETSS